MRLAAVVAIGLLVGFDAGLASAQAMDRSPRPQPRPTGQIQTVLVSQAVAVAPDQMAMPPVLSVMRPKPRPAGLVPAPQIAAAAPPVRKGLLGGLMRPKLRPEGGFATKAAVRVKPSKKATTSKKGSVCGDPGIKGEEMSPIKGKIKGCGVADPVRITSVAGVRLSTAATIDCPTARALKQWVEDGLQPALGRNGAVELTIAAHYICRGRNNVRGAKISEHGRGKAVDISAVVLEDGSTLSVERNFKTLRRAHKAACGVFGTTLGPGSDGYHEDHMHFDTASHRNGSYCR